MTPSIVSRLAFVFALTATGLVSFPSAAQSPPTAGFPIEPAPSGSAKAPAPAPAPAPSVPPSASAPAATPPPPAPAPAPASATPAPAPAPTAPAAPPPTLPSPTRSAPAPTPAPPPAAAPTPGFGGLEGAPPPEDGASLPAPPLLPEIGFEEHPGWGVELAARGGLGVLAGSDARSAFAFGGGFLGGHYGYVEFGLFYDQADSQANGSTFSHAGGIVGAWLPYHNWVDFEVAAGLGVRHYTDSDPRYGTHGYKLDAPALSLIAGVSDRAHNGNVGGRVGGQIVLTQDLKQKDEPWLLQEKNDAGDVVTTRGMTHAGGFSASLVLVIGLDYGDTP